MKARAVLSMIVVLGLMAGMWGSVAAAGLFSQVAVPYISQYQGQSTQNSDCGPASGAMVLQAYGKRPGGLSDRDWVVQVRVHSGSASGYLTFPQLEAAVRWYGLGTTEIPSTLSPAPDTQMQRMKEALAANQLVIALVHGATLGRGSGYGDHFVVVRGFSDDSQQVYVNDPDNRCLSGWLECGGQTSWSYARFRLACNQAQAGPYGIIMVNGGGGGPSGYTFCANENQLCSFSGTKDVAYGANSQFFYKYGVANGIDCNNATFGDPISGVVKACYTKDSAGGCPSISDWRGEYWNNQSLSGSPTLCRNDSQVDFNWGTGSPGGGVPNDKFSARWTRNRDFAVGRYRFHLAGDDGIRLWVDANLIIDQWKDQGRTEYTAERDLSGGSHSLKVDYYENGGDANITLWWEAVGGSGCSPSADQIALFVDANYSGQCVTKGIGSYSNPAALGLPNDSISSIKVGSNVQVTLCRDDNYSGTCETFTGNDSDLTDNSIGNDQVSSAKVEQRGADGPPGYAFCANEGQRCNFSGTKDVAYGANSQFFYKYGVANGIDCNNATFGDPISGVGKACYTKDNAGGCPSISDWRGEYWNNQSLSGTPTLCRNDSQVDFNWGTGSPGGGVPNDKFSARWTRSQGFAAGRYRFHLAGDDGIRLWVDTNLIIDQWKDQGRTEYTAERDLSGGSHSLKVEYYENGGDANITLWWETVGGGGCSPGADQIALFVDANYSGQCVTKGIGSYSNPAALGLPNDSISSIKVGSNVKATLCRDDNYSGTCESFTDNDGDLTDSGIGNDQVSSAKVESRGGACAPSADQIALFVDANYSGQCVIKGVGSYSNPSAIALPNDSISSIKVGSNVKATLCRDDGYVGGCETFSSDDNDLTNNSIGNDQVSSAKVEPRGGLPGYTWCANEGQRCNFSGTKDVAYGANGQFYYKYGVVNGIDCSNATFGDPIYGVAKACYIK